jgi:hypothetical protein
MCAPRIKENPNIVRAKSPGSAVLRNADSKSLRGDCFKALERGRITIESFDEAVVQHRRTSKTNYSRYVGVAKNDNNCTIERGATRRFGSSH